MSIEKKYRFDDSDIEFNEVRRTALWLRTEAKHIYLTGDDAYAIADHFGLNPNKPLSGGLGS